MKLVRKLLADELKTFDNIFTESLKSKIGLLDKVIKYVSFQKGKQLRPILVLLSARLCGGISDDCYRAACLIEYLHSATLIHDDVVDDSYVRRKKYSVKALWGNKLAVILGDYMLSKGLLLSIENKDFQSLQILAVAVKEMAEAEMLQFERNIYSTINEKVYYDIIKGKTASLFAAACSVGAWTATKDVKRKEQLHIIGENLGMAFQIKDDLFDFDSMRFTGKPTWKDLRNKKATLPFLYTLKNTSEAGKQKLNNLFENQNASDDQIREVIDIIKDTGGIDYASKIMLNYAYIAMDYINQFDGSVERLAFEDIIQYSIHRSV